MVASAWRHGRGALPSQAAEGGTESRVPFALFCVYTFVLVGRPQDYLPLLASFRPALTLTGMMLLITLLTTRQHRHRPFQNAETKLYLTFFAALLGGIPFSLHRGVSFDSVVTIYLVNVVFYVLFLVHVNTLHKFRRIIFTLALTGLVFTVLGLREGVFEEGRYSTEGAMFDPNDIAFVVISLLGFSIIVCFGRFSRFAKAVGLTGAVLGLLLALYTGSRGGLLGLSTFFALFLLVPTSKVPRSLKFALIGVIMAAAAFNSDKINTDRYQTLGELQADYNTTTEFGRVGIWERGLDIFLENPITGVGVDRFGQAIGASRSKDNVVPEWQSAHNSYVQVLVETGLIGAVPFLLLIVTCIKTFIRVARRAASAATVDLGVVPATLLVGFIAQLLTAFFLSQAYSMFFTLTFAMAATLKGIVPIERSMGRV